MGFIVFIFKKFCITNRVVLNRSFKYGKYFRSIYRFRRIKIVCLVKMLVFFLLFLKFNSFFFVFLNYVFFVFFGYYFYIENFISNCGYCSDDFIS